MFDSLTLTSYGKLFPTIYYIRQQQQQQQQQTNQKHNTNHCKNNEIISF